MYRITDHESRQLKYQAAIAIMPALLTAIRGEDKQIFATMCAEHAVSMARTLVAELDTDDKRLEDACGD